MPLDGKVLVVTGASGGVGRVVVPLLAKDGAITVMVDRELHGAVASGQLELAGDVTDEKDVRRLVSDILAKTGRIDGLINLVGAFAPGRLIETEVATWQKMLTLNLTSAFLLSKAVIPHMVERRRGRIIHI